MGCRRSRPEHRAAPRTPARNAPEERRRTAGDDDGSPWKAPRLPPERREDAKGTRPEDARVPARMWTGGSGERVMSRCKPLNVVDFAPDVRHADTIAAIGEWFARFEAAGEHTVDGWVPDERRGGFHPPHNRRMTRGDMMMEVCHPGFAGSLSVRPQESDGEWLFEIQVPMRPGSTPDDRQTIAHVQTVFHALESAVPIDRDTSTVDTWSRGIAGIAASLGATSIGVDLSCPWTPLRIQTSDDVWKRLPGPVRRRISTACPRFLHLDVMSGGRNGGIEIGTFSRSYTTTAGDFGDDLGEDAVTTMRAVAAVLDATGLSPQDVRP